MTRALSLLFAAIFAVLVACGSTDETVDESGPSGSTPTIVVSPTKLLVSYS